MRISTIAAACGALLLIPAGLSGQTTAWAGTPADSYTERFRELWSIKPSPDRAAPVRHLVLKRDAGELIFEEGALFRGKGTFNFTAPLALERERLRLFRKTTAVAEPFEEVVLLFADSTLAELQRQLTFGPGEAPGDLKGLTEDALKYLGDEDHQSLDPDVMRPVLNGEQTGLFYAHMTRAGFDPWMFEIDAHEVESVRFMARGKRTGFTHYAEPIAQFPRQGDTVRTGGRTERRSEAGIRQHTMKIGLPESGGGGLGFRAAATLAITADTATGAWVPFYLFDKLSVDSGRWESGTLAVVFKGKDSPDLWVRLEHPLKAGEVAPLKIYGHGDLLDRALDLFVIKTSISWCPLAMDERRKAIFDLPFDTPEAFALAVVGDRTDSAAIPDHMVRTAG